MKKILLQLLILPAFILVGSIINHLRYKPIIISAGNGWTLKEYNDSVEDSLNTGNFTTTDTFAFTDSSMLYKATLGVGAKYNYGGVNYLPNTGKANLKGYDLFELEILPGCSDFFFTATLFVPGFSDSAIISTHKFHHKDFSLAPDEKNKKIFFNELVTPPWWFSDNNTKRETLPKTDMSHFTSISISNHSSAKGRENYTLHIGKIRAKRSINHLIFPTLLSMLLFLFISITYLIFPKPKKEQYIVIKPSKISENTDHARIITYVGENYSKKGISIDEVAQNCSLSTYQVRKEIQANYKCSFNEYIRKIRIEEGARLLEEGIHDVKQIANEVGFSHASSFNRAFKQEKGLSPTEFKNKKPNN